MNVYIVVMVGGNYHATLGEESLDKEYHAIITIS